MNLVDQLPSPPQVTEAYDTSTPAFNQYCRVVFDAIADQIIPGVTDMPQSNETIALRLAIKLHQSQEILSGIDQPVTVTLLNPVYKETGRIQTRDAHPHGENSIRFKIEQLRRMEDLNANLTMRFVVIDDECPNNSGRMAEEILRNEYADAFASGKYVVHYLSEAIDSGDPLLPPGITHKDGANRSVKGGALLFGMRKEIHQKTNGKHILIDNDADLSIHVGQIGNLIEPILQGTAQVVAGSRREADSVSLIGGERNVRGQFFIQIWQHFLPDLSKQITDTNRAFKAFEGGALKQILDDIKTYTFPYQIEVLQAAISKDLALGKIGVGYVDSEAASTQSGSAITETYLNQIRQIIDISQRYHTISPDDKLLQYFESIDEADWQKIETNPPRHLSDLI